MFIRRSVRIAENWSTLFMAPAILAACQPDESSTSAPPEVPEPSLSQMLQFFRSELNASLHKGVYLSCEGYLAQYENEDYCVTRVPDDWVPFEFNGQTYYRQPLSASGE